MVFLLHISLILERFGHKLPFKLVDINKTLTSLAVVKCSRCLDRAVGEEENLQLLLLSVGLLWLFSHNNRNYLRLSNANRWLLVKGGRTVIPFIGSDQVIVALKSLGQEGWSIFFAWWVPLIHTPGKQWVNFAARTYFKRLIFSCS